MFVQSIIGVICRWDMLALFARVDIFNVNFFETSRCTDISNAYQTYPVDINLS